MTDRQHYRDQAGYTTQTVEAYLPSIWDSEWVLQPRLRREAATGVKTKIDPRHISDHLLSAADIQVGYRRARLDDAEKECLRHVYHLGFTPGELSTAWGVSSEQVHLTCQQAIQRITNYLSGRTPK